MNITPGIMTLNSYGLLRIAGTDAKKLLQGQLTCNVEEITDQQSRLAALCNPQGRIISFFLLFQYRDDYYAFMLAEMVDITLKALKKYAVFYKVSLENVSSTLNFQGYYGAEAPEGFYAIPVPGSYPRWLILDSAQPATASTPWLELDILSGIPTIYPTTSEKFLPHDLNLHLINGISFDKGCYTGQEIIARMHYRGKLKNHLERISVTSPTPPLPGSSLFSEQKELGTIVAACEEGYNKYQVLVVTTTHSKRD